VAGALNTVFRPRAGCRGREFCGASPSLANEVAGALQTVYGTFARRGRADPEGRRYLAVEVGGRAEGRLHEARRGGRTDPEERGYLAGEVGETLKIAYGLAAQGAAQILKNVKLRRERGGRRAHHRIRPGRQRRGADLKNVGYLANQIADALEAKFGVLAAGAAGILRGIGFAYTTIADAIRLAYELEAAAVGVAMKAANFIAEQVAGGIAFAFGIAQDGVAIAMKAAGFPW
jgi:hypothetical protein